MDVNIEASDRFELRRILRVLLELTDNKYEIVITAVPGNSVRVPQALFEKFKAAEEGRKKPESDSTAEEAPAPKKRGRPRKKIEEDA